MGISINAGDNYMSQLSTILVMSQPTPPPPYPPPKKGALTHTDLHPQGSPCKRNTTQLIASDQEPLLQGRSSILELKDFECGFGVYSTSMIFRLVSHKGIVFICTSLTPGLPWPCNAYTHSQHPSPRTKGLGMLCIKRNCRF